MATTSCAAAVTPADLPLHVAPTVGSRVVDARARAARGAADDFATRVVRALLPSAEWRTCATYSKGERDAPNATTSEVLIVARCCLIMLPPWNAGLAIGCYTCCGESDAVMCILCRSSGEGDRSKGHTRYCINHTGQERHDATMLFPHKHYEHTLFRITFRGARRAERGSHRASARWRLSGACPAGLPLSVLDLRSAPVTAGQAAKPPQRATPCYTPFRGAWMRKSTSCGPSDKPLCYTPLPLAPHEPDDHTGTAERTTV